MQLRHRPAVLALSRQALPTFDRRKYAPASGVARGAYVMAESPAVRREIILIASGSEVCAGGGCTRNAGVAGSSLAASSPCRPGTSSSSQPQSYREEVLPPKVKARIAIEQGSVLGWDRYVGPEGRVIGMKTFGASAPLKELQRKFGFEPERIVAAAKELLERS